MDHICGINLPYKYLILSHITYLGNYQPDKDGIREYFCQLFKQDKFIVKHLTPRDPLIQDKEGRGSTFSNFLNNIDSLVLNVLSLMILIVSVLTTSCSFFFSMNLIR